MAESLSVLEQRSLDEDDSPVVPPPDIVAYNELRSCADLFRMHEQRILEIQPDFQREVVWSGPDQTRSWWASSFPSGNGGDGAKYCGGCSR